MQQSSRVWWISCCIIKIWTLKHGHGKVMREWACCNNRQKNTWQVYRKTSSKHSSTCTTLGPFSIAMCRMFDTKVTLQAPCLCEHCNIVTPDHASRSKSLTKQVLVWMFSGHTGVHINLWTPKNQEALHPDNQKAKRKVRKESGRCRCASYDNNDGHAKVTVQDESTLDNYTKEYVFVVHDKFVGFVTYQGGWDGPLDCILCWWTLLC